MALNLEEDSVGVVLMGETSLGERGRRGPPYGTDHVRSGRGSHDRPGHQPLERAPEDRRPSQVVLGVFPLATSPGAWSARTVQVPLQTGPQGHRRHGPHRPRPARADHRRPPDRQDRGRPGRDHQPEGQERRLHLRRHRPEAVDGGPGREDARGLRGHGAHHRGLRRRLRARALPLHRALRRLRDRRVLPRQGQARPLRLRRPDQSTPRPTARSRCCCAVPRAARPTRATSSTCTAACWSARPSSTTRRAGGASPRCPSSRPRRATSRPTSRPTSSPSPTARSSWSPTSSTPASARPSTSATRCAGWAGPPR